MRVLLTRLSALGDIVHTWPLADALGRGENAVRLAWVVEEPFLPLVAGHPAVAEAIPVATRRWRRRPLAAETRREFLDARHRLRRFAPDVALDPQGLCKSAAWALLSGTGMRVGLAGGFRRERLAGICYTGTVTPPPGITHVVDINLSLASALDRPVGCGAVPDGTFLLRGALPEAGPAPIVLLPGTGGQGKAWPASSFAALARGISGRGFPVTVGWGPGERALAETVTTDAEGAARLAPATTLPELAVSLASAAVVVGGDTGPVHLAASLAVPTVAIFLSTDPARNGPRGRHVTVVTSARPGARGGRARSGTLGEVGVDQVLSAVLQVLEDRVPLSR